MRKNLFSQLVWGVLCLLPVLASAVVDPVTVEGTRVTVSTERYRVVLDGLAITEISNRITGEVYAQPVPEPAELSPALKAFNSHQGVLVHPFQGVKSKSKKRGADDYFAAPTDRTKVESQRIPNGVRIVYTGLYAEKGEEPQMVLTLDVTVDPANGDLCMTPKVKGNIPVIAGCPDRGVQVSAIQMRNLSDELALILPVDNGGYFSRQNGGFTQTSNALYQANWPQQWQAAVLIAESPKGCLAMWADEEAMQYQRMLNIASSGTRWHTGFKFGITDLAWQCQDISGGTWRFNVFSGYWAKAAARYREQCERQWPDMRPVEQRTPEWARQVRVHVMAVLDAKQGAAVMKLLPPGSHVIDFTTQAWLSGWNNSAVRKIYGDCDGIFPNWPYLNPVRYEGVTGIAQTFTEIEKLGVHVFPYMNTTFLIPSLPWVKEKLGYRHHFNWLFWGRFFAEFEDDVVKRYGVSGIYEDCSWVGTGGTGGDVFGTPDGMSGYRGTAEMRKYFRTLQPNVATMGERRHEATARSQMFALQVTGWGPNQAHPILAYLQEPYCRIFNFSASSASADVDDIQGGLLTDWKPSIYFNPKPCQEDRMWLLRGQIFTREQLLNYWPETWNTNVAHYYKSKDGVEFRMVKEQGMRFVKCGEKGNETLFWRLRGAASTPTEGSGIEGWIGYDGDRFVGLNPRATYCAFPAQQDGGQGTARPTQTQDAPIAPGRAASPLAAEDVKVTHSSPGRAASHLAAAGKQSDIESTLIQRPPVTICAVPAGFAIKRSVVRDGFWIAELDSLSRLAKGVPANVAPIEKPARTAEVVRVRGGAVPVKFTGVESVKELPNHEYDVTVKLPGGFGAYWTQPGKLKKDVAISQTPALNTVHRRDTGLVVSYEGQIKGDGFAQQDGMPQKHEEGTVPWVFDVPMDLNWLLFKYGGEHAFGDGAVYMVRVNGNTVWKRLQPASIGFNKEKGEPIAAPAKWGAIDLRPYQNQTIVLELAVNGNHSEVSEVIKWQQTKPVDDDEPAGYVELEEGLNRAPKAPVMEDVL